MEFDKLQIKNYKCFDEEGTIIELIKPINVIIGKNNSGKSSIVELFKFLATGDKSFFSNKRNGKTPEIICEHIMKQELIKHSFPESMSGGDIGMNHYQYGLTFADAIIKYSITENNNKKFINIDRKYKEGARRYLDSYIQKITLPVQNKSFSHLSAERDIQPESPNSDLKISTTGVGATNLVQQIINRDVYDSDLIEVSLLGELNKIVNPDIKFSRILVQQNENGIWEIYFENINDGRIPLSKMGSGIKTILLVLILLHVKPIIDKKAVSDYVFALEELENNLHPSLQRRLYHYLYEFSKNKNCVFILTTHSNIVIDLYNSMERTQIFHINKVLEKTTINSILRPNELKKILEDLDVRASDILQSNGIIWVEGPSDRTYLNKWINILDKNLIEGYHYSIMFYGGRLLSNLSFDYEMFNNELIPLLKLNTNSYVVIDRDGKTINVKLNETKNRIQNEIGEDRTWITKGREIENYLSNDTLEKWLSNKHSITAKVDNEENTKLEENILKSKNATKIKYNLSKSKYASEIVEYIQETDITILDLKANVNKLIQIIRKWNKI